MPELLNTWLDFLSFLFTVSDWILLTLLRMNVVAITFQVTTPDDLLLAERILNMDIGGPSP